MVDGGETQPVPSTGTQRKDTHTMREDEYGRALETALKTSDEPLTASDLTSKVGCSRQRTYTWIQAHENHIEIVGKDRKGGNLLKWRDSRGSTGIGDHMTITSFFVEDGRVVLVLEGPNGETFHARPA